MAGVWSVPPPPPPVPQPPVAEPVEPTADSDVAAQQLATSLEPHDDEPIETEDEIEIPEVAEPQVALEAAAPAGPDQPDESDELEVTVEPPVSGPIEAPASEPLVAAAQSDLPPSNVSAPSSPPVSVSMPPPVAKLPKAPPGASRWLDVARRDPALWMVVAPICIASLLVLIVMTSQPQPPEKAPAFQAALSAVLVPAPTSNELAPAAAAKDSSDTAAAAATALEGRDAASLTAQELLLRSDSRAQRKRADAKALSQKLQAQPELAKDPNLQADLLGYAVDPDTAAEALAAMSQAPAPIGPDLLYEVWSSRLTAPGTAELARSLLYSRDVRPAASPALAAVLALRGAEGCEATQAALVKAQTDGDRRAISALTKLTSRRGCGATKRDDCYPCLRDNPKQIIASAKAAQGRHAPSYPTVKPR